MPASGVPVGGEMVLFVGLEPRVRILNRLMSSASMEASVMQEAIENALKGSNFVFVTTIMDGGIDRP